MLSAELKRAAVPVQRISNVIWLAFAGAPVVYAVIAWLVTDQGTRRFPTELPEGTGLVFLAISFVTGILLPWVIAPRFLSAERLRERGTNTGFSFGTEPAHEIEELGERDRRRAEHLDFIQQAWIIRWAGAESVAIFALIALFMGVVGIQLAWIGQAVSLLLVLALRPDVEASLEEIP